MKTRTSILLETDDLERLKQRAKQRGTTVTREIREAVAQYLTEYNPNAGLHALIGIGRSDRDWPPVDSDEAKQAYLDDLERDTFNREPDR
jgi:hypothetical protein